MILQQLEEKEVINPENVKTIIQLCMQHFVDNNNCSILDFILTNDIFTSDLYLGLRSLNDNIRIIAFNHLVNIYSRKEQKPTMVEYETVRNYIINNENNLLTKLFEDNWQEYLVMIQQKCIEPIKSSE